jgi:hypothetical protein
MNRLLSLLRAVRVYAPRLIIARCPRPKRARPLVETLEGRALLSVAPGLTLLAQAELQVTQAVTSHTATHGASQPHHHAVHHHAPVHHIVRHALPAAPALTGDNFFIFAYSYPTVTVNQFHNLKILSMAQTTGTTNDGGPIFNATGTWDSQPWSGTLGWHPTVNDFVVNAQWTYIGHTFSLQADITPAAASWSTGDLQVNGQFINGSPVHGQQTSRLHLPPSGGVNLVGDVFTVYAPNYPGNHNFHYIKILSATPGWSNSLGPVYNATGTFDGKPFIFGDIGWEPSFSQFVLDFEWWDGRTYAMVANIKAPTGNWSAGDLQLEAWWHDSSQVTQRAYGQQTGGPHPWDNVAIFTSGATLSVKA